MLKIIKERIPEAIVEYHLEWYYDEDRNAGFSFPANSKGEVDTSKLTPEGKANYESCLANKNLIGPHLFKDERTYINPAVGKCSCGQEIVLDAGYDGAVMCPNCGKWYNLFGQELVDPKYWEEDYDY